MNAFVRKEIRLILPATLIALVLAVLPVWVVWPFQGYPFAQAPGLMVYVPFGLGVLLLGLSSFGQELSLGTFSMLLAQPISRRRLWRVKTTVLLLAGAVVLGAFAISTNVRVERVVALGIRQQAESEAEFVRRAPARVREQTAKQAAEVAEMMANWRRQLIQISKEQSVIGGAWMVLSAVAGGLWTTLLFRNTTVAFWMSLMIPPVLGSVFIALANIVPDTGALWPAICLALVFVYPVVGFIWARSYFPRAQDLAWTGGVVSLPSRTGSKSGASIRSYQPLRSMVGKELQLQQINLLIGGFLLLAHLVVLAVRRLFLGYLAEHPSTAMVWESWPAIWLILPLLIGSTAVAEERKMGTLESFLCTPGGRKRGGMVKFGVALVLGVLMGGVLPWVLEWLGIQGGLPDRNSSLPALVAGGKSYSIAAWWLLLSAGLVLASLHASSLARSFLQAMGQALGLVCFWVLLALVVEFVGATTLGGLLGFVDDRTYAARLWAGALIAWIGWPVLVGTVLALVYRNYQKLQVGAKVWRRNGFAIFGAVMFTTVTTTMVYHRAWEIFMAEEPLAQAPAAAFQGAGSAELKASINRVAAVLPDGKLWLRQTTNWVGSTRPTLKWREGFVGGSNWREVAVSFGMGCFAIQQDGSLWDLSQVLPGDKERPVPKMVGSDDDWKTISMGGGHITALKTNGTLWQWGLVVDASGTNGARKRIPFPVQVGRDSDWVAIADQSEVTVAVKSDGSVWRFGAVQEDGNGSYTNNPTVEKPERWLVFPGVRPRSISLRSNPLTVAAVGEDGSLWLGGASLWTYRPLLAEGDRKERKKMVALNMGGGWKEFRFKEGFYFLNGGGLTAVKQNGELWEWAPRPARWNYDKHETQWRVARGGTRSDWVSVSPFQGRGYLALARDGSVCEWQILEPDYLLYGHTADGLLAPSRIKARKVAQISE